LGSNCAGLFYKKTGEILTSDNLLIINTPVIWFTSMVNGAVGTNAGYSSGSYNGQVGLTKSVKVVPGDVISASVYAKYIDVSGPASNLANFATSLTEAFALSPGMPGEAATACQALNAFGSILATGDRDVDDENAPRGFINILVFDEGHNLVDFAFAAD
jgi:hypothetical protein